MENLTKFKLNRRRWAVQLTLTTGLTLLFLTALLWGLQGVAPARADPGTLYVDGATGSDDSDCSNPADPCATIGYALTQAGNGDEICVAEGTYTETLDIAITVTLKGGYTMSGTLWLPRTGATIVDADGADDSVIHVFPYNEVTLEGFTIQGANHTGGDSFGGIAIDRSAVIVSGTIVQDNQAEANGGGIYIQDDGESASLTLVNSSILNNSSAGEGGGIATSGWPTLTLQSVLIQGNTAQGSGGGLQAGRVTITNSAIVSNTAGNDGGGIQAWVAHIYTSEISGNVANGASDTHGGGIKAGSMLYLQDSVVSNNRAVAPDTSGGSGIVASNADVTIVNTRISDNKIGRSTVALYSSVFTITNSLVVNNDGRGIAGDDVALNGTMMNVTIAGNEDVGIWLTADDVRITNSILWGNAWDIGCDGNCTVTYSDFGTSVVTGTGNISADPLFADAINGDYHLQVGSPCIDKGTPVGAPTHDIEGAPRDAAPDMGAYEWTGFRIFLPLTLRNVGS